MALSYTNGSNNGIFDILGKYFHAIETLNTARGTTVPDEIVDALDQYKLKTDATIAFDAAVAGLPAATQAWRNGGNALASAVRRSARGFLVEAMRADSPGVEPDLTSALEYLIAQMVSDSTKVDANSLVMAAYLDTGANGDELRILLSEVDGKGAELQNIRNETLECEVATGGLSPTIRMRGDRAASGRMADDWPTGSAMDLDLDALSTSSSLLSNGDFELFTNNDTPDDWIPVTGTPGTTFRATNAEVQTVIISGTPTSGGFFLKFTHPVRSKVYGTTALTYNATGAEVQAALRELPGLSDVVVVTTGTTPNYTHTITFTGMAGNLAALTSTEDFDTGSIAHATSTEGDAGPVSGLGFWVDGTAEIYQPVTLTPGVVYAAQFSYHTQDSATITLSLVDAIGGTTIQDDAATSQSLSVSPGAADDALAVGFFRVAADTVAPVYAKLRVAASDATVIDNVIIEEATQLYDGGPFVAVSAGRVEIEAATKFTLTTGNDYACDWQKFFDLAFDMASKGLQLPVSGSTTIADSLIG